VLFHGLVSLLVLAVARIAVLGGLPWTVVLVPLVLAPLVLLAAGLGWFLASLGVFVRDLGHVLTLLVQILLFATPIFYPVEAVPETLRPWVAWQPLAWVVESMRRVVLWGQAPDWVALPLWLAVTGAVALVGYAWFMKTKRAFADVL
jgi:lipopolysaccharide transport system permease protein